MNRRTHLRLNVIGVRRAAVWAAVGLCMCILATAQSGLTPEIAAGLRSVTDIAIDPAGRKTAYVLSVPRDAEDEHGSAYSEIWMVDIASGDKRRFTRARENASSPRWSPDGSKLTYPTKRSGDDDETQIFTLPIDGGESEPFTKHQTSISDFDWSPDGRWIAFTAIDPKSDDEKSDQEAGRDWTVVDKNLKLTRLWVADAETGTSQAVYDVDLSVGSFVWTPDSNALIMQAADTPRTDDGRPYRSISAVPREGGEPDLICARRRTRAGAGALRWRCSATRPSRWPGALASSSASATASRAHSTRLAGSWDSPNQELARSTNGSSPSSVRCSSRRGTRRPRPLSVDRIPRISVPKPQVVGHLNTPRASP